MQPLIEAIKASGRADLIAALEALGATPTEADVRTLHARLTEAVAAPPDPTTRAARRATKRPGRSPVRIGANVRTAKGAGKVTAVTGTQVTVTHADGTTEEISVASLKAHMAVKTRPGRNGIPAQEAEGDLLNREDSWDDVMQDVRDAVAKKFGYGSPYYPGSYCYIPDGGFFDGYVIAKVGDEFYRVSWTQGDDDTVTLGELEPVEMQWVTTSTTSESTILAPLDDDGHLLEATATVSGKKWLAVFIQEGMSKNRNFYPGEVLREAVSLYENKPIYRGHEETPSRFGRNPDDAVGFTKSPRFTALDASKESAGPNAIVGQVVITDPIWRAKLVEAWEEGNPNFVGFSHDVLVKGRLVVGDASGPYKRAEQIESVKSLDLVMQPAAGGRLMQMVAANGLTQRDVEELRMLQKMIEAIKASGNADLIRQLEALGATATEEQVMALHSKIGMKEAVTPPPAAAPVPAAAAATTFTAQEAQELREALKVSRKREAVSLVESSVRDCGLPEPIKARVKKRFGSLIEAGAEVTEAVIVAELNEEIEAYGKVMEKTVVVPAGGGVARFEMVKSTNDQFMEALDDFFGVIPADKKTARTPGLRSFREIYTKFTGDDRVTGRVEESVRLSESLNSGSFTKVLGDSITRRLVQEYTLPEFQVWRDRIATVVPLNDFRTQHRMRFGGYANFPIVAQGAPYLAMTSPTDEEATYSPSKRGGTEAVTLEMIKNDDVGVIKRIPVRLGRAAGQTLYEFVFDFMRTNANIYDSTALAVAGHGTNIITTALSATNVLLARLRMRQQTDMSSGKRLGLKMRYLWVPSDLEDLARQICQADRAVPDASLSGSAAPAAPNPVQLANITPMTVDYWTDTNDYWATASPDQCPMVEVGFLDGREDPELFVQDQPNVGSLFSNDAITWKLRHIYGGVVEDFRGFVGGIVP